MPREIRYINSRNSETSAIDRRADGIGAPTSDLGCVASDKVGDPRQDDAPSAAELSGAYAGASATPPNFYYTTGGTTVGTGLSASQKCTMNLLATGTSFSVDFEFFAADGTKYNGSITGVHTTPQTRLYVGYGHLDPDFSGLRLLLGNAFSSYSFVVDYVVEDRNDDTITWNFAGDTHANSVELTGNGKFAGNVQGGDYIHRYKVLLAAGQTVNFSGVGYINPERDFDNNIRVTRRDPDTGDSIGTVVVETFDSSGPSAWPAFSITNEAATTEYVYFAVEVDFGHSGRRTGFDRMGFYELEIDLDNVIEIGKTMTLTKRSTVHLAGVSSFPFGGSMIFTVNDVEYSEPGWVSAAGTLGSQGSINGAITLDPGTYDLALKMTHTGPAARDTRPYSSHFNAVVGDNTETTSLVL